MRKKGLLGIALLIAFSGTMWYLIRAGGHFETTAKILIAILGSALGFQGVSLVIEEAKKERHSCYLCGAVTTRFCDFQMHEGSNCGRWACHLHMKVSEDGKRDHCSDHHNLELL